MNHIIDMEGSSIYFGEDFIIVEKHLPREKHLIIHCAGKSFILSKKPLDFDFSSSLPGQVISDFSKD